MSREPERKVPAMRLCASDPADNAMPGVADASPPESESRTAGLNGRWAVPGVCIFLAAIVWAVFGQTAGFEFVNYDDGRNVYENPAVEQGLSIKAAGWAFTHVQVSNWIPLTTLSHMLDCQIFGLHAGGHHLVNVLLHAATVLLLFLLLRQMTGSLWRSAFVAAVFAIHPLRAESVAWVSERKDVLSAFFFMLTIGAYVRHVRQPSRAGYVVMTLLFALGLMAKSMVATLPFVLLLLDYWPLGRFNSFRQFLRLVAEKIPLFALSAAACAAVAFVPGLAVVPLPGLMTTNAGHLPFFERAGSALVSYVIYLRQMIVPAGLAIPYPAAPNGPSAGLVVLAIFVLGVISAGVVACRKRRPFLLTGWLWYLGMLFPVIGIIKISGDASHADRYTYLPEIGLAIAGTWAVAEWSARWKHRRLVSGGLMAAVVGALTVCGHIQTSYWRDGGTLWTHSLACTPDNDIAYNNLGNFLLQRGKIKEATANFQRALQINPDFADALNNLGYALLQSGNVDEAIIHFQKALQINPDDSEALVNLGGALLQNGDVDEAIARYKHAVQINPNEVKAHINLGSALLQKGNVDEAVANYEQAVQINPDDPQAHFNLGCALLQKGNVDEAIIHFQKALQINPNDAEALNNLGSALLQKGAVDEAVARYQQALQINPDDAQVHYNLGNALLQKGDVAEAIVHYQQALQINPGDAPVQNNLAWLLATAPQESLRDGNKAVELAQRANQLAGGRNPVILRTLAAAYAEAGRFSEAVETAQRALQLAGTQSNTALADSLLSQLKLYQAGLPFHLH